MRIEPAFPQTLSDMDRLLMMIEQLDARLRAAEATIALLNDRLAWAEAELAAQAHPFAPPVQRQVQTVAPNRSL